MKQLKWHQSNWRTWYCDVSFGTRHFSQSQKKATTNLALLAALSNDGKMCVASFVQQVCFNH